MRVFSRIDRAYEQLTQIIADHKLPSTLANAITELICAHIAKGN